MFPFIKKELTTFVREFGKELTDSNSSVLESLRTITTWADKENKAIEPRLIGQGVDTVLLLSSIIFWFACSFSFRNIVPRILQRLFGTKSNSIKGNIGLENMVKIPEARFLDVVNSFPRRDSYGRPSEEETESIGNEEDNENNENDDDKDHDIYITHRSSFDGRIGKGRSISHSVGSLDAPIDPEIAAKEIIKRVMLCAEMTIKLPAMDEAGDEQYYAKRKSAITARARLIEQLTKSATVKEATEEHLMKYIRFRNLSIPSEIMERKDALRRYVASDALKLNGFIVDYRLEAYMIDQMEEKSVFFRNDGVFPIPFDILRPFGDDFWRFFSAMGPLTKACWIGNFYNTWTLVIVSLLAVKTMFAESRMFFAVTYHLDIASNIVDIVFSLSSMFMKLDYSPYGLSIENQTNGKYRVSGGSVFSLSFLLIRLFALSSDVVQVSLYESMDREVPILLIWLLIRSLIQFFFMKNNWAPQRVSPGNYISNIVYMLSVIALFTDSMMFTIVFIGFLSALMI